MRGSESTQTTMNSAVAWSAGVLGIAAIGWVDFVTGIELRIFPLYYAPISLLAWRLGQAGALIAAALSVIAWIVSNGMGGMTFSHPALWAANALMQAISFAAMGYFIASLKGALTREKLLSQKDSLTSLLNGRAFYEEADRILALCRRAQRPITLAYIDLDNFKTVNDTHGHQAGDDLIRRVAALLRKSMRPGDLCARLGGDEFVVLLPDVDSQDAVATLDRLRILLADTLVSDSCPVTGSIGAVTFVTAPDDLEKMLQLADFQMYSAKSAGKNRLHHNLTP